MFITNLAAVPYAIVVVVAAAKLTDVTACREPIFACHISTAMACNVQGNLTLGYINGCPCFKSGSVSCSELVTVCLSCHKVFESVTRQMKVCLAVRQQGAGRLKLANQCILGNVYRDPIYQGNALKRCVEVCELLAISNFLA